MMRSIALFAVATTMTGWAGTAGAVQLDMLGDQDLTDGQSPVFDSDFSGANAGDPSPFNIFFGDDRFNNGFGSLTYTHNFSSGNYSNASIEIGLLDHDSFNPGQDTIDILFDGVAQDTSIWEGISIRQSSYHIRAMDVDSSLLTDGSLVVEIIATASGFGTATLPGNGIGVDFSKLSADPAVIPLPASGLLVLGGLGLLALRRRKSPS